MGNSNTKESRSSDHAASSHRTAQSHYHETSTAPQANERPERPGSRARQSRFSRADLNLLGLGAVGSSNFQNDAPFERRETKQEREARRLEKERIAREKERERSMKEEYVDGGYLVTLGTYTGPEDFSKPVVRQLQIERKIAPFWRGLNDYSESWTEYQLICAGRGMDIPAADEQPPADLIPLGHSPDSPAASTQNLHNLTVPLGPRSLSVGSDRSGSNVGSALPSPSSPTSQKSPSAFKPRAKALAAALSVGSRNASQSDITPREISLPNDPFVNGQPLEVFLYKNATECPICFMYYPPYLNRTRCCDQSICSECFVQIKRPEPHYPEHHNDPNEPTPEPEENPEMLISEPATCPYCQQAEFGVIYEAPPFRRGLTYSFSSPSFGSMNTAMSSQSSLNSTLSPTVGSPPAGSRRRTQSLSANAPNVITTDRVRPDWSSKLATQRAHQARRAAAATALHTAAFLMGNNEPRGFAFTRPGRFSRRNTGASSSATNLAINPGEESPVNNNGGDESSAGPEPGPRGSSGRAFLNRRNRMEELEDMMFMEAVRLSLAAEEERKRKEEKEARKDAKKKEKEERKAFKQQQKHGDVYGGGQSSASGSSLSLGLGRRRGNSAASNLRVEATVQSAMTSSAGASNDANPSSTASGSTSSPPSTHEKGKGVDRNPADSPSSDNSFQGSSSVPSLPIPTSRGPSHLRQMSNASSISSSLADSAAGSYATPNHLDANNPRASGLSLGGRSDDGDRDPGGAGMEPMFNFRSLAEMVGVQIEGEDAGQIQPQTKMPDSDGQGAVGGTKADADDSPEAEQIEHAGGEETVQESIATLRPTTIQEEHGDSSGKDEIFPSSGIHTPEVMITPVTPAPLTDAEAETKKLGHSNIVERSSEITQ